MTTKKRLGRPPKDENGLIAIERQEFRCTKKEKKKWRAAAKLEGLPLGAWIKQRLNK